MRPALTCRSCGHGSLAPVVDLGLIPLSRRLRPLEEARRPVPRWPLVLVRCPRCGLAQLSGTPPGLPPGETLAGAQDPNAFVCELRESLGPGQLEVLEVPYLIDVVRGRAFDALDHELPCLWSLAALERLFTRHGLYLVGAARAPRAGWLRVSVSSTAAPRPGVEALLEEERLRGAHRPEYDLGFARQVRALRAELLELIARVRCGGQRLAAWGASPAGTVLLNTLDIDRREVELAIDPSPARQGRVIPGTGIRVHPPERIERDPPDCLLLLERERRAELLAAQRAWLESGGRVLVPLPRPEVIAAPAGVLALRRRA